MAWKNSRYGGVSGGSIFSGSFTAAMGMAKKSFVLFNRYLVHIKADSEDSYAGNLHEHTR